MPSRRIVSNSNLAPVQQNGVNPFSNFVSNNVNMLTRIVSGSEFNDVVTSGLDVVGIAKVDSESLVTSDNFISFKTNNIDLNNIPEKLITNYWKVAQDGGISPYPAVNEGLDPAVSIDYIDFTRPLTINDIYNCYIEKDISNDQLLTTNELKSFSYSFSLDVGCPKAIIIQIGSEYKKHNYPFANYDAAQPIGQQWTSNTYSGVIKHMTSGNNIFKISVIMDPLDKSSNYVGTSEYVRISNVQFNSISEMINQVIEPINTNDYESTIDATKIHPATEVIVYPGVAIKDDVMVNITGFDPVNNQSALKLNVSDNTSWIHGKAFDKTDFPPNTQIKLYRTCKKGTYSVQGVTGWYNNDGVIVSANQDAGGTVLGLIDDYETSQYDKVYVSGTGCTFSVNNLTSELTVTFLNDDNDLRFSLLQYTIDGGATWKTIQHSSYVAQNTVSFDLSDTIFVDGNGHVLPDIPAVSDFRLILTYGSLKVTGKLDSDSSLNPTKWAYLVMYYTYFKNPIPNKCYIGFVTEDQLNDARYREDYLILAKIRFCDWSTIDLIDYSERQVCRNVKSENVEFESEANNIRDWGLQKITNVHDALNYLAEKFSSYHKTIIVKRPHTDNGESLHMEVDISLDQDFANILHNYMTSRDSDAEFLSWMKAYDPDSGEWFDYPASGLPQTIDLTDMNGTNVIVNMSKLDYQSFYIRYRWYYLEDSYPIYILQNSIEYNSLVLPSSIYSSDIPVISVNGEGNNVKVHELFSDTFIFPTYDPSDPEPSDPKIMSLRFSDGDDYLKNITGGIAAKYDYLGNEQSYSHYHKLFELDASYTQKFFSTNNITSCNQLVFSGSYVITGAASNKTYDLPTPIVSTKYVVNVINNSSGYIQQECVYRFQDSADLLYAYHRYSNNSGSTWSTWLNNINVNQLHFQYGGSRTDLATALSDITSNNKDIPMGTIIQSARLDTPQGCLPCDGSEWSSILFPEFWTMLNNGKLPTKTYAAWQTEYTNNGGNVGYFAVDTVNGKFKTICLTDAFVRSIPTNTNVGKYGQDQIKNISGTVVGLAGSSDTNNSTGSLYRTDFYSPGYGQGGGSTFADTSSINLDASRVVNTGDQVQPRNISMRAYVVVYNGVQESSEMNIIDFLATKANVSLDNIDPSGVQVIKDLINIEVPSIEYITEHWQSADGLSWYKKYNTGWIEQGGRFTDNTSATSHTINLVYVFSNTNYTLVDNHSSWWEDYDGGGCAVSVTKSTGSFVISRRFSVQNLSGVYKYFDWVAYGY